MKLSWIVEKMAGIVLTEKRKFASAVESAGS